MAKINRLVDLQYEISQLKQSLVKNKDKSNLMMTMLADQYKNMSKKRFYTLIKQFMNLQREIGRTEKKIDYLKCHMNQMELEVENGEID